MRYNTRPVTNTGAEPFTGRFNGVDFLFKPKQTRYLPSFVATHLANQLILALRKRAKNSTDFSPEGILGTEIETKDDEKALSFGKEMEEHEKEFARWQEEKKKRELLQREEAVKIADQNV